MEKKYKRNQYLINPAFQLDVIKKFIALVFFNILSFYWIIFYFFFNLESKGKMVGLIPEHPFFLFVNEQKKLMLILFFIIAIINITVILLTGVLISHKVAGPLYRLRNQLDTSDFESVDRINFRKDDYFLDVENSFNNFIERSKKNTDGGEIS